MFNFPITSNEICGDCLMTLPFGLSSLYTSIRSTFRLYMPKNNLGTHKIFGRKKKIMKSGGEKTYSDNTIFTLNITCSDYNRTHPTL
jgi:hypothetical protein